MRALPFLFISIVIHSLGVALLLHTPAHTPPRKPLPFKEKFVQLQTTTHTKTTPPPSRPASKPATPKPTQPTTPKPTPPPAVQKPQSTTRQKQLQAIASLAASLEKHLDNSHHTPEQTHPQPDTEVQNDELRHLLQTYIVLPFNGEVRIKLTLTPQGEIHDVMLLTPMNKTEEQRILTRVHEIPFKKFTDKYKISKNLVFHIKLRSNES